MKIILLLFFACGLVSTAQACINGPDASLIQQALDRGEDAILCRNSVFTIFRDTIRFRKNDQAIYTEGYPIDESRALLRLPPGSPATSLNAAINGRGFSRIKVKSIQVDGNRVGTERYPRPSDALLMFGAGGSVGVELDHIRAYNPKGWSILHMAEDARGARITNNHFGPAGHLLPDVWADGISLGASDSEIIGNIIEDPTDGGIVVFGAPGSRIIGNTIRSKTRPTLGSINLVDFDQYKGDFSRVVVERNSVVAQGAQVKIGIAMGPQVWYCDQDIWWAPGGVNRGAEVNNNLVAGNRMAYGLAIHGVSQWVSRGNVDHAKYSGVSENRCRRNPAEVNPSPGFQFAIAKDLPGNPGIEGFTPVGFLRSLYSVSDPGKVFYPNDSELLDQDVPFVMQAGQRSTIRLTFRNTGNNTWTSSGGYKLGSLNPQDNNLWGAGRIELVDGSVPPGGLGTFQFDVTAPALPGQYHMQWGILQEHVEWFGDVSNNVVVDVRPAPSSTQPVVDEIQTLSSTPISTTFADLIARASSLDGSESDFVYTWSQANGNPGSALFSVNNSHDAKATRVTFSRAGTYNFNLLVQNTQGESAMGSLSVQVSSTLTEFLINPSVVTLRAGEGTQFIAIGKDQFGEPVDVAPIWNVGGGGAISPDGTFTADAYIGTFEVTAMAEAKSATAQVTVVPVSTDATGPPVPTRAGGVEDFSLSLRLPTAIPADSVLSVRADTTKPIAYFCWLFYQQESVGNNSSNRVLRVDTSKGEIALKGLALSHNQRYQLVVIAITTERKQSRPAKAYIRIIDPAQNSAPWHRVGQGVNPSWGNPPSGEAK